MKTVYPRKSSRHETAVSVLILAVLAAVAAGVYLRQYRINPAVIALRPESQRSGSSASDAPETVIDTSGSDLIPFSAPEHFGPDTLYEKIDGRADLYLASGFDSLRAQRFTLPGSADNWIEVFVYDMQTAENAFSVYSMQRREGAPADDSLPGAYRTENALFMTQGPYYLELIGTNSDDQLQRAMGIMARRFVESHGGSPKAQTPGADLFPAENLDAGSRQLITANAFGNEALDNVYAAEYVLDGTRLSVFVSDRQEPEAASKLADDYTRALVSFGALPVDTQPSVDGATILKFFDTYEIVFTRGRYLAGVHEAAELEKAGILAGRLADHLQQRLAD